MFWRGEQKVAGTPEPALNTTAQDVRALRKGPALELIMLRGVYKRSHKSIRGSME